MPNYRPRGKHRRKAPALDDRQQVSSFTFSARDLHRSASDVTVEAYGSAILSPRLVGLEAWSLLGGVVHR